MAYSSTFSALGMSANSEETQRLNEVYTWSKNHLSKAESLFLDSKLEGLLSRKDKGTEMMSRVKGLSDYCENFTFYPQVYKGFYYINEKNEKKIVKGYGNVYYQSPFKNFDDKAFKVEIGDLKAEVEIDLSVQKGFKLTVGNKYNDEKITYLFNTSSNYYRSLAKKVMVECAKGWVFVDFPKEEGKRLLHAVNWVNCVKRILEECTVDYVHYECLVAGDISVYQQIMYCV